MLKIQKLNESFSSISGNQKDLKNISDYLRVERPGAYFEDLVKKGFKSPFEYFASVHNGDLIIMNGHRALLGQFGIAPDVLQGEYTEQELNAFLQDVKNILPFPPYDYQEIAFKESILGVKQISKCCTGSGKSLIISLMIEFFRRKGKKGLLLVPNINLLTQFKSDIKEYNLLDLYNDLHVIGGGSTERHFNNSLTISTWQSLQDKSKINLDELDYVITDECHRFASDITSSIVKETTNCKYKYGFTGTLPEDPVMKMELLGLFGLPKTYITSYGLIERGLGTPIKINSIIFNYSSNDKALFKNSGNYTQQLKFIKEHEKRNEFIINLSAKLRGHGNSLVLFQHTEHGKTLFIDLMKKVYPDVEVSLKDITGKKSYEFQEQHGIYFLNGEDDAKTREATRRVLEDHDDAILIANFSILSTGVNIKKLHNMVLASPLKSYTTVTQSIGRGMRLHESKKEFVVYDLVDNFGIRKPSGIFYKQYEHRKNTSYNPEQFPVQEREFNLF